MKKLILVAVLAMFAFTVNAQDEDYSFSGATSEGTWLIEANTGNAMLGTTGFYLTSQDGNTNYNIGLDGGYFIIDDFAIKAGLGYGSETLEIAGTEFDVNTISYRLGAKYYLNSMIPVTVDLTGASIEDADENPLWLGLGAGYAWFVADNIAIEPGLRYNLSLNEDFTDEGIFQVNIGFTLFLN